MTNWEIIHIGLAHICYLWPAHVPVVPKSTKRRTFDNRAISLKTSTPECAFIALRINVRCDIELNINDKIATIKCVNVTSAPFKWKPFSTLGISCARVQRDHLHIGQVSVEYRYVTVCDTKNAREKKSQRVQSTLGLFHSFFSIALSLVLDSIRA